MDPQQLCHFQHLRGQKAPTTKQSSRKELERRKWSWWITSAAPAEVYQRGTSCLASVVPACQESPAAHPDITCSLCLPSRLLEYLRHSPCTSWAGSRLFPMWLQYQPKAEITQPSRCCVETGVGNGLSLKASEPVCHVSLTCCLVFSPTSRLISRLQKMPQRTYAKGRKQTLWKYNLSSLYFFFAQRQNKTGNVLSVKAQAAQIAFVK